MKMNQVLSQKKIVIRITVLCLLLLPQFVQAKTIEFNANVFYEQTVPMSGADVNRTARTATARPCLSSG